MNYKFIGIFICMLLICTVLPVSGNVEMESTSISLSSGYTLYVGGSGPGNYTSIQEALDDAKDGYNVFIYNDSSPYHELLVIDKSINLIGEDRYTTVIDGESRGIVIFIRADGVTISCLTVRNPDIVCIVIRNSSFTIIQDNIIFQENSSEKSKGIEVSFKSSFANISGNEIYGFYDGLVVSLSDNNIIYRNNIHHNYSGTHLKLNIFCSLKVS